MFTFVFYARTGTVPFHSDQNRNRFSNRSVPFRSRSFQPETKNRPHLEGSNPSWIIDIHKPTNLLVKHIFRGGASLQLNTFHQNAFVEVEGVGEQVSLIDDRGSGQVFGQCLLPEDVAILKSKTATPFEISFSMQAWIEPMTSQS